MFHQSLSFLAETNFGSGLEEQITALSWQAVGVGTAALVILILIASFTKDRYPILNKPLFILIIISVVLPTVTLIGSTVYLNTQSYKGGPVHWHADIEFWACGNELELRDPQGLLSNKIGTPTLHEHDDKRIHLEGVPITAEDASLGKFMSVIGGEISQTSLSVPVNDSGYFEDEIDGDGPSDEYAYLVEDRYIEETATGKFARFENGTGCDSTEAAEVQAFLFRVSDNGETYSQKKIEKPQELVITPDANVPPGDCIVMEFDTPKDFTDKICEQFGVRDKQRCEEFGVEKDQREICELEDTTDYSDWSEELISRLCRPFYDENGTPTEIKISLPTKPDGEKLDLETDCEDYQTSLQEGSDA